MRHTGIAAADLERRSRGKLYQQHSRKARLGEAKGLNGLNNIVLQNPEVLFLKSWDELTILAHYQRVHRDQRYIHVD